jgi:hypothetical protein
VLAPTPKRKATPSGPAPKRKVVPALAPKAPKRETKAQRETRERSERATQAGVERRAREAAAEVKKFDKRERARERRLEKKLVENLRKCRDSALGGLWSFGGVKSPLHGSVREDWYVLRAKRTANDADWRAYWACAQALGMTYQEAVNEWFSPKM